MDEGTGKDTVDDEELDKMIANIQGQPAAAPTVASASPPVTPSDDAGTVVVSTSVTPPVSPVTDPVDPAIPAAAPPPAMPATPVAAPPPELSSIKQNALAELKPLVDRLTLSPADKFRTTLLIIRSTDDVSLLPIAYEAARAIPDENQRAQALLDIIKEVDFFSQQTK
ncbi:hypothetical protein FWC31_01405 [Candidatus Saccharibacteria bacterium]|nr:hypothetical protein [Candidatus Saccharibacteria bacterium]